MNKAIFFSITLGLLALNAHADTIELSNGKKMEGTFVGREGDTIKFDVDGISMSFQAKDVKNISMGTAAAASPGTSSGKSSGKAPEKSKASAGPVTIAAGTTVMVKLSDTLDSGRHTKGHKFSAALEGALVSNGVTVAAAGSKVYGVITEAVKSRRLAGNAKLMIMITDINIGGQITPVTTSSINALTKPTGASTVGRTARAAAIGGLIDGSSGAKTGAKVGLGASILKGGNQVVIPAGTLLEFKLSAPLQKK